MRPFCRVVKPVDLRLSSITCTRTRTRCLPTRTLWTPRHSPKSPHRTHIPPRQVASCNVYTANPTAQRGAFDSFSALLLLSVTVSAAYIAKAYLDPPSPVLDSSALGQPSSPSSSSSLYPEMSTDAVPGRPGSLTPEQEQKLKEFWIATLDVFGVDTTPADRSSSSASTSVTGASTTPAGSEDGAKHKRKHTLFKSKKSTEVSSDDATNDKHGQTKEFKDALASTSPETLHQAFWTMVKHDDPDALLLRFLRARKWDVHAALVMLVSTMHWRAQEMHVEDIMLRGEEDALKNTGDKDSVDFLSQVRMGKSVLHGIDKQGRPLVTVRVRLHHGGDQTEKSMERYTVHTIETTRMLLRGNVDTATIIFDMTNFSMSNMDYTPVKFMIKCFEANYPESLGQVVVYKAPWVFNQIWRIIKGWLDPVVASKIHFAKNIEELDQFVPRNRILKELDGAEDYTYKYIEPVAGENKLQQDTAGREAIEAERNQIMQAYERDTVAWMNGKESGQGRPALRDQLRDNYWKLDPFVRAKTHYDREGVLGEAGKLNFYPAGEPSAS